MNIFEQLGSLIDDEVLKDKTSNLIDELPLDKHTFLDSKKDPRFITVQRDSSGYGEIIMKLLPFPDRIDKKNFMLIIDFMKHDKVISGERISENCPKTIGLECAICDNLPNIPKQLKHIIQGIVIDNSGSMKFKGEIKLFDMTRKLLSIVASDEDSFMKLFDINSNIFLKIVIRKDDNNYFTYDESHLFEDDSIDIKNIIKEGEEFYYKDIVDTLYNKNNFMSYDRMVRKYVKHLQHKNFNDKEKYETPRNSIIEDPIVDEEDVDSFMDDIIDDIIQDDSNEEVENINDSEVVEEIMEMIEDSIEEDGGQEQQDKNEKKEDPDIEKMLKDENFFNNL